MSALALGLIAAACWGFHDICVRAVSQKTPLLASLMTVLVVGLAFHLVLMAATDSFTPLPAQAAWFAALSGVFFLVASLGLYAAFQRGPVRLVSPIIASFPILSVGWAATQGTEISALQWGAVLLIIIGVSLVAALADTSSDDVPPKGPTIIFAALSAIGFASTFAISQHAAEMSDDMPVTLVARIVAITLLLIIIATMRLPLWPGRKPLFVLALMGIADGIALYCVVSAAGLPDAQYAAVAASTFGLLTIVMAWAFLREAMTPVQWLGCLITFAGIGYLAL
jgi:drug/metabolite transporter (DMT)-like permease